MSVGCPQQSGWSGILSVALELSIEAQISYYL